MRSTPSDRPARRTGARPATAIAAHERSIIGAGLLLAIVMLSFYVQLLHAQVERGEQFRAQQVASAQALPQDAEPGQPPSATLQ